MATPNEIHGGRLVANQLRKHGVTTIFTLSGGHIFPIFDGARAENIALIDVRHEATAAFAAEGWAKLTRTIGVAAVTAGPGVTNTISALASAQKSGSPLLILGGRAPLATAGQGSLQEIDHIPIVKSLTKFATTAKTVDHIPDIIDQAINTALTPPTGPVFIDFPADIIFAAVDTAILTENQRKNPNNSQTSPDKKEITQAANLIQQANRPIAIIGNNAYWQHAENSIRQFVKKLNLPVFASGLGRGIIPADDRHFFARARSVAYNEADLVILIGVPLDFRLGFGKVFNQQAKLLVIESSIDSYTTSKATVTLKADSSTALDQLLENTEFDPNTDSWFDQLITAENQVRTNEEVQLKDDRAPLHPMRLFSELIPLLDRDAIVIGDGGDFVSFAGRVIDTYEPGHWLDPGPYGCLGCGPGYAIAAKLAYPESQVVLLMGDGSFGFSGLEFDTLVRHQLNIVGIIGNNGVWALEKYPMEALYGYSVAAELRPAVRYDQVVAALGAEGYLVSNPDECGSALRQAFASNRPALVNVLIDPNIPYPRKTLLI